MVQKRETGDNHPAYYTGAVEASAPFLSRLLQVTLAIVADEDTVFLIGQDEIIAITQDEEGDFTASIPDFGHA